MPFNLQTQLSFFGFVPQVLSKLMKSRRAAKAQWLALLVGASLSSAIFAQDRHALLIGVSAYPSLEERLQLNGPKNDVVLMRDVLKTQGFAESNIRILADGVTTAQGLPTRAGIITELRSVAQRAKRGDFVYLLFAGHGSQQPTRAGKATPEPDGLDEIFLPVDIGKWDGSVGSVQNAIRDEELGELINAIRAKGAFVWATFDACHSGNITRGGSDDETRLRKLDPTSLGIPQQAIDKAQADSQVQTRGAPQASAEKRTAITNTPEASPSLNGMGGFVFFYAAQTTETTPEKRLPEDHVDRKAYGVFTYTIAQVLAANPGISYRQAAERVLQLYSARNLRSVTPVFEGSALDAPVFGQKAGEPVRQWRPTSTASGIEITAGSLQQFGVGAVFAVLPNAASKDNELIGYMRAQSVDVLKTVLVHTEYGGKPALQQLPRDAVVRLANANVSLTLKVSIPAERPAGPRHAMALKVIDALKANEPDGLKIQWVAANQSADLRLALADEQIWLVSPDGAWLKNGNNKTPSIKLDDKNEAELRSVLISSLQSISKASNLFKIGNLAAGGGSAGGGLSDKLEARFFVTRISTKKREEINPAQVPTLLTGDRLQLTIKNNHSKPMDVTVLAVDARYGITLLYPASANENNRIHPRDSLPIPGDNADPIDMNDLTSGREAIVIIAVEAEPNTSAINLGFLEQASLDATRGSLSGGQGSSQGVIDLFEDAGFGSDKTRGPARKQAADRTAIRAFNYVAKPK